MIAEVFWIRGKFPGRIALVPRPRGGDWLEDEAAAWSFAGLDVIVSLLDSEENDSFDLRREGEFCKANGIEFFSFSITDRSVPVANEVFLRFAEKLKEILSQGKNIGIHCRQSVGRAPLLATVLMLLFGVQLNEAFRRIGNARGVEVPETNEQRKWLEQFAEELSPVSA